MKTFEVFRASRATRQRLFKTSSTGHANVTLIKWVKKTLTLQLVPLFIKRKDLRVWIFKLFSHKQHPIALLFGAFCVATHTTTSNAS